jgi:steroid delta-isomerase-like uncharacterized protein
MSALENMARKTISDFNESNWDAIRDNCAADIVYTETGTGLRIEGVDALDAAVREWKVAFSDLRGEILRVVEAGDTVVAEIAWRGTHDGPLETPAGTLPASGRTAQTLSTMWFTCADGKVTRQDNHLDTLTLLAQIGAIPAPTP